MPERQEDPLAAALGADAVQTQNETPAETPGVALTAPAPPGVFRTKQGGWLWAGPAKNPKAGPGRPPNEIRRALRNLVDEHALPALERYLTEGGITCEHCGQVTHGIRFDDLMAIVEKGGKFGLGTVVGVQGEDGNAQAAHAVVILPSQEG